MRFPSRRTWLKVGLGVLAVPLLAVLAYQFALVRETAVGCAGWFGASAVPYLSDRALRDPDSDVRHKAMKELQRLDAAAVPPLLQLLSDPSAERRRQAAYGLFILGPTAREAGVSLTEALKDADPEVRERAIRALMHCECLTPKKLRPLLKAACEDPNEAVRTQALDALSQINVRAPAQTEDLSAVLKGLEDPAAGVRKNAVRALAALKIDTPEVRAALKKAKDDPDKRVAEEAEESLEELDKLAKESRP